MSRRDPPSPLVTRGSRRCEGGSATVPAVVLLALVLLVGAGLGVVAAMFVAHRSAQSAADLAALAAAAAHADGGDACGAGRALAARNGGRLVACGVEGEDVRLTVEVDGPRWLGQRADLVAEARAGPARSTPGLGR